jgi:hypothetical protein
VKSSGKVSVQIWRIDLLRQFGFTNCIECVFFSLLSFSYYHLGIWFIYFYRWCTSQPHFHTWYCSSCWFAGPR